MRVLGYIAVIFCTVAGFGCTEKVSVQSLSIDGQPTTLSSEASICFSRASTMQPNARPAFDDCVMRFSSELPKKAGMRLVLSYQYYPYYQICVRKTDAIFVQDGRVTSVNNPPHVAC